MPTPGSDPQDSAYEAAVVCPVPNTQMKSINQQSESTQGMWNEIAPIQSYPKSK